MHPTLLGGGFGGKVGVEAAIEAVRLSHAVKRPVRVQWSREENFHHAYFRPPTTHRIQAGLTGQGRVSHWKHEVASGPVIFSPGLIAEKGWRWVPSLITYFVPDFGAVRGVEQPYGFEHQEILFWDQVLPVPTGAWRGLGASVNAFAIESAVDELAALAGMDPLAFRLAYLDQSQVRLRAVLQAVARKTAWGGNPLPKGKGRGLACGVYRGETYVAVVAEVALDEKSGRIRVERLTCAHDCGLIINPDLVEAQIEGNLMWGVGMALKEALYVKDGRMSADNFDRYQVLRCDEAPEVAITLIENKSHQPTGVGEPAIMPTPAAIANAIFQASGKRVTRLPIRPVDVFS